MPIRQLPIELANQIAAGEVVERPSSVVKELIENALDAGATELTIELEQGGIKRIKIRDNGSGIARDELPLALSRHATSKIGSLEDLESIASLGFRGEALASISSVSRLRLTSKPASQSEAWQAWTEGRDMAVQIAPAAHPDGTTIDIQDLFFNTPARRKFLRTEKTEFSHVDETIKRIALSRFDVSFTVEHQGKRVRHYPKLTQQDDSHCRRRLSKVCGASFAEHAVALSAEAPPMRIYGWVAPPEECRHQADIQYCFVNGRMMRDKLLNHAIRQAYERYLLPERVPTYVLYFELPPQQVDVNVHPAKHEVRFHQQRQVHDFILQAVAQALTNMGPSSTVDTTMPAQPTTPNNDATAHHYQTAAPRLAEQYSGYRAGASILPNAVTPVPNSPVESATWRALTVINDRWLLINSEQQVAWLDIRAVHFQRLQAQIGRQWQHGLSGQPLLVEVAIDLDDVKLEPAQFDQWQALLSQAGIQASRHGRRVTIENVPSMLRHGNVAQHVLALIQLLAKTDDQSTIVAWLASHALLPSYSLTQAEQWLQQWQRELNADAQYLTRIEPPKSGGEDV